MHANINRFFMHISYSMLLSKGMEKVFIVQKEAGKCVK